MFYAMQWLWVKLTSLRKAKTAPPHDPRCPCLHYTPKEN
jgi:hypothetical protein